MGDFGPNGQRQRNARFPRLTRFGHFGHASMGVRIVRNVPSADRTEQNGHTRQRGQKWEAGTIPASGTKCGQFPQSGAQFADCSHWTKRSQGSNTAKCAKRSNWKHWHERCSSRQKVQKGRYEPISALFARPQNESAQSGTKRTLGRARVITRVELHAMRRIRLKNPNLS